MPDRITPIQRSKNMAAIRGRDTIPELAVRRFLHAQGLRYRIGLKSLPGRPDIVLRKYQTVIFVHGCFWHRHDCPNGTVIPGSRQEFWQAKFAANVTRDKTSCSKLNALGWRVLIVWECQINYVTLKLLATRITVNTK